jgi:Arc/MetJ-type ribon-helix-helix transcriptional regulator
MMQKVRLNLEKAEQEALDHLVEAGIFPSRDEAARAAILKYAMDIGVLNRKAVWQEMETAKRREITPKQLAKDLETLEDES